MAYSLNLTTDRIKSNATFRLRSRSNDFEIIKKKKKNEIRHYFHAIIQRFNVRAWATS